MVYQMALPVRDRLEQAAGGLWLMIFFTFAWTAIAEIFLRGRDYWLVGVFFLGVIGVLISQYLKFTAAVKKLGASPVKESEDPAGKKKEDKGFLLIFVVEGVAILVVENVLANTGLNDYFIPALALIVGLHFFPLGKVFKRPFDYYMGAWTSLVAIVGIVLIHQKIRPQYGVIALVAIGCALATSGYGIQMALQGNVHYKEVNTTRK